MYEVTQADREAAADILHDNLGWYRAAPVRAGEMDNDSVVQAFARHRTQSAAHNVPVLLEALRQSIDILEAGLKLIAGSHWERFGMDQTDIEELPDLSDVEAMQTARSTLMDAAAIAQAQEPE